ncbi:MAG: hypothetical protein ABJA83_00235 [Burkholderiaceae bacterium]
MPDSADTRPLRDSIAVVLVSLYLIAVGAFLVMTRRIATPPFRRIFRALARRSYAGPITTVRHEGGHCYLADLPPYLLSDYESHSSLVLTEDGAVLGPAHAAHDDIRKSGGGRFAHWGAGVYFSTSDNSDPRANGRSYAVREMRPSLFSGT